MVGESSPIRLYADEAKYLVALAIVSGDNNFGDLSKIIGRSPKHTRQLAYHPKTRAYVSQIMAEVADRVIMDRVLQVQSNTYSNIPITDTIQQVIAAHTVKEARRQRRRRGSAPADSGAPGQDTGQDQDRQDTQQGAGIEAQ